MSVKIINPASSSSSSNSVKNYMINGDMSIAQRGTSFVSPSTQYVVDRYLYSKSGAVTHTVSQDTSAPTATSVLSSTGKAYEYTNSLLLTLTAADNSISATDFTIVEYIMEGNDWKHIFGNSFSISFWVNATTTGIYSLSVLNNSSFRSYVAEYTVNSTNTWEYKTITIPTATSAADWGFTNGEGARIIFSVAAGSNYFLSTNTWQTGTQSIAASANQVNGTATGSTSFRLTGVSLNLVSSAPFQLYNSHFQGELDACQRYYQKTYDLATAPAAVTFNGAIVNDALSATNPAFCGQLKVSMRVPPTVVYYNPGTGAVGSVRGIGTSSDVTINALTAGQNNIGANTNATTLSDAYAVHFTADADF